MKIIIQKIKNRLNLCAKTVKRGFLKPTVIFLYHRISEVADDPHLLSVNPENFEKQLLYLQDNFKIIRLSELVQNLKNGKMVSGSATITFDDGYADNFSVALPILEKHRIPATFFITAGKIGSKEPFYWDEKTDEKDRGRAITENELKEIAKSPLIEIGAHTMTHPHLSALPSEKQKYEIEESKKILENILNKPVVSFSYPFGSKSDFSTETMRIADEAGFQIALTTIKENIKKDSSLFAIPRRIIRNWSIPELKNQIRHF